MLVYCQSSSDETTYTRLTLDYITDQVVDVMHVAGEPYVSPDARNVVTIDRRTNTISVYDVDDSGVCGVGKRYSILFLCDLKLSSNASSLHFM